jgi:hypothetical protein
MKAAIALLSDYSVQNAVRRMVLEFIVCIQSASMIFRWGYATNGSILKPSSSNTMQLRTMTPLPCKSSLKVTISAKERTHEAALTIVGYLQKP